MTTIAVTYIHERGYVRFVVEGAPAGYTVKRRDADGALTTMPGFETDAWLSGGAGYGEDYQPPIGADSEYVVVPVASAFDDGTAVAGSVTTPGNEAWLRDVAHPVLARSVVVVSTGEEVEPIQQTVYAIAGRRLSNVVHDVRNGRRGTVTLLIRDAYERQAIEALLATGNPLLLSMCVDKGWAPCMMAISSAGFTRLTNRAVWTLALDYLEVADPWIGAVNRIGDPLWEDIRNGRPHTGTEVDTPVTWAWVQSNFGNWLSVAAGQRH